MLDEVKLEKEFVEFLNRKMEESEDGWAELSELLVEYLSKYADVSKEEILKELDAISEEAEQIFEGNRRSDVLYSALKALKEEPTLEDFIKLYYITLAFQYIGEKGVIDALKGESAEEILAKAGREDLIKQKLSITFHFNDNKDMEINLKIPRDTLRVIIDELYRKSMTNTLTKALVDISSPLLFFKIVGGNKEFKIPGGGEE